MSATGTDSPPPEFRPNLLLQVNKLCLFVRRPAGREEGVRCVRTNVCLRQFGLATRLGATRWNQKGD